MLPASGQTVMILRPGKQLFNFREKLVPTQWEGILRLAAIATVGRDHREALFFGQSLLQGLRIASCVADLPLRQPIGEASGHNNFHKPTLRRRITFHRDGVRKIIATSESDDLGALTKLVRADGDAPFWGLAEVAFANASSRLNFLRWCRCFAIRYRASMALPSLAHYRKRRWQVGCGGYLESNSARCVSLPNIHSAPFTTARVPFDGLRRLSSPRAGRRTRSTNSHSSSASPQGPAIVRLRRSLSTSSWAESSSEPFREIGSSTFYRAMFKASFTAVKNSPWRRRSSEYVG